MAKASSRKESTAQEYLPWWVKNNWKIKRDLPVS